MVPIRVIYEKGITAQFIGSDWYIINTSSGLPEKIGNLEIVTQRYNVRPVIITERATESDGNSHEFDLLLRTVNRESFGLKITDWEQYSIKIGISDKSIAFDKFINIEYLLRAVEYHCIRIALLYAEACKKNAMLNLLFNRNRDDQREWIHTGVGEIYYEFDAMITAIRRTYDSYRYLLWHYFGTKGSVPSSFYRTLECCPRMPITLKERLIESWSKHGEEVTSYRDCIQHYVPIDFGISSIIIQKFDEGILSIRAPIPNNPSAKSRYNFKYDMKKGDLSVGRDALTYGWEAANEVLEIAFAILESVGCVSDLL